MKSIRSIKFITILGAIIFALILIKLFSDKNLNEIGLYSLSRFKNISGNSVPFDQLRSSETSTFVSHDLWDQLLKSHVSSDGKVNYVGFQNEKEKLKIYLDQLSRNPPDQNYKSKDNLAYWINVYNAFTIQLIIENYPLQSIKELGGSFTMINSPWDKKFFEIGGVQFDLNTIEHEILRKKFKEPKIHFAINCASISCPNLRNEAYTAERLEEQLTDQTKIFLADPTKNLLSTEVIKISPIFSWFRSDFEQDQSLIEFINMHSTSKIKNDALIKWMEYDWDLNE